MLRTDIKGWDGERLWHAYIQLTEAEAAFRIHKSDLTIRPIWHQKTDRVQAHVLVCFLAYVVWKTIGQMCSKAGLGDEPRRIFTEISKIKMVDVVLPPNWALKYGEDVLPNPPNISQFSWTDLVYIYPNN